MNSVPQTPDVGYLTVKVTTARGAIPLAGASVLIRSEVSGQTDLLYSLSTDESGLTPRVSLPAPSRVSSESPGDAKPYATYGIDVAADGYLPLHFSEVPVFASVVSIQPAVMIPAPDGPAEEPFPPLRPVTEAPYGHL